LLSLRLISIQYRQKVQALSITQDKRFSNLNTDIQTIIQSLLKTRFTHSEDLQKHFEALTESQKYEHAQTRATFIYMEEEKRQARVRLSLLESLRFPMMNDRYEKLARAHEQTFLWIFKCPQSRQKPWDNFAEWLSIGAGTYWIQGKAASGKSTLMRFIWNNPQTLEYLRDWAEGERLVVATFFFWNSGIPDQRSQSGLLRSLLHEVLKNRIDLIPDVLPEQWEKTAALAAHDLQITVEEWSLGQLERAFEKLVKLASLSLKLCFFIDGLDEYDGDPADLSQFFLELSGFTPHAKFCISSRPWPVFQDIYEGVPGLKLQDLTHDDIVLYIRDKLGKSKQMKWFLLTDAQSANGLIEELVEKAAGVFLWVVLVVKSLVNGLRNGDDISHLRRRLASLPSDLEDLYSHMLKSIDPLDREEASQIFQIFRTSGHCLDIPTLERALRSSGYHHAIDLPTKTTKCTDEEIERIQMGIEKMTVRLNSRSKGLLEVLQTKKTHSLQKEVVPPQTDLPLAAEVWFNSWVACGPGIDSVGSVIPRRKARREDDSEAQGNKTRFRWKGVDHKAMHESQSQALFNTGGLTPQYDAYGQGHTGVDPPSALPIPLEVEQPVDLVPSQSSDMVLDDASIEEELGNDSNSGFLQISYLHRTVRDFLEQEHIWDNLLSHTKQTDFDPKTALLVADVLELKTTERMLNSTSVYDGGIEAVTRVGRLAPLNLEAQVVLLEELGRAIGAHWVGERTRTRAARLSRPWEDDPKSRHQKWQGDIFDILSSVMMSLLRWYIDTKLVTPYLPLSHTLSPPLLAYALGLELWCVGETVQRAPVPDYNMVENLLYLGCNPNAPYKGYSIWGYIISFLHVLNDMEETRERNFSNLTPWIRLCMLLLDHGADPNVCCVKDYHCWWLEVQRSHFWGRNQPVFNLEEMTSYVEVSGKEVWEDLRVGFGLAATNSKYREKSCSVTTVVAEVFMRKIPLPGARELLSVLESKKTAVRDMSGSSWVKNQRKNRKKKGRMRGC
jgi:hypothetical protein